jgi:hypothetical protein
MEISAQLQLLLSKITLVVLNISDLDVFNQLIKTLLASDFGKEFQGIDVLFNALQNQEKMTIDEYHALPDDMKKYLLRSTLERLLIK